MVGTALLAVGLLAFFVSQEYAPDNTPKLLLGGTVLKPGPYNLIHYGGLVLAVIGSVLALAGIARLASGTQPRAAVPQDPVSAVAPPPAEPLSRASSAALVSPEPPTPPQAPLASSAPPETDQPARGRVGGRWPRGAWIAIGILGALVVAAVGVAVTLAVVDTASPGLSRESCGLVVAGAAPVPAPALCADGHPNRQVMEYLTSHGWGLRLFALGPNATETQADSAANGPDSSALPIEADVCQIATALNGWTFTIQLADKPCTSW